MKAINGLALSEDLIEDNPLEEIIQNLSPEEKELHRDLIEEVKGNIKAYSNLCKSLKALVGVSSNFLKASTFLADSSKKTSDYVNRETEKMKTDIYYIALIK